MYPHIYLLSTNLITPWLNQPNKQPNHNPQLLSLNKFDDIFITKTDTQRNIFSRMFICARAPINIHLWVHIVATYICNKMHYF